MKDVEIWVGKGVGKIKELEKKEVAKENKGKNKRFGPDNNTIENDPHSEIWESED